MGVLLGVDSFALLYFTRSVKCSVGAVCAMRLAKEDEIVFIFEMLWDLFKISKKSNLDMLSHFIAMAIIEAENSYKQEVLESGSGLPCVEVAALGDREARLSV